MDGKPGLTLDDRAREILQWAISTFITTGKPVGSRTIARRSHEHLSAATVRNIMADLEEMGYLRQPHPSAGRIPTDKAYRLYVDSMLEKREISPQERQLIDRVLAVAALGAAAVPGLPLPDTVKETDAAGLVVRTVPRDRLVVVQTPQAFPRAMLETAHQRARSDATALTATDDAALCERLGHAVRVVAGSPRNIKITTQEDFAIAEALAAAEPVA